MIDAMNLTPVDSLDDSYDDGNPETTNLYVGNIHPQVWGMRNQASGFRVP